MTALVAPSSTTYTVLTPTEVILVTCGLNDHMVVDSSGPAGISGRPRVIAGITATVGPWLPGTVVTLRASRGSPDWMVSTGGAGTALAVAGGVLDVTLPAYGAKFDWNGTTGTDNTAALQAAIDAASAAGGGVVLLPSSGQALARNLVLKSGVSVRTLSAIFGYGASGTVKQCTLVNPDTAGWVIDTPAGGAVQAGIEGINFKGGGSGVAIGGIRLQGASTVAVRNCNFDSFANQGVVAGASAIQCVFEHLTGTNCLLNRSRAAIIGCFDIQGTDHRVHDVEMVMPNAGSVSDSNLYLCAARVGGSNHFIDKLIGSYADQGIYIDATNSGFTNCRADLNFGHGYSIVGSNNTFSAVRALNNSKATSNTYDGFNVTGGLNTFASCMAYSSGSPAQRYGFTDTTNGGGSKNFYSDTCKSIGHATGPFNTQSFWGSAPSRGINIIRTSGTTFDVGDSNSITTAGYSSATTVTDFVNGSTGQIIYMLAENTNVTIANNGNITTTTGANKATVSGTVYKFFRKNGGWVEFV